MICDHSNLYKHKYSTDITIETNKVVIIDAQRVSGVWNVLMNVDVFYQKQKKTQMRSTVIPPVTLCMHIAIDVKTYTNCPGKKNRIISLPPSATVLVLVYIWKDRCTLWYHWQCIHSNSKLNFVGQKYWHLWIYCIDRNLTQFNNCLYNYK